MGYERGDVYFVDHTQPHFGSEQNSGRPAIIVSADANNQHSNTVEIVYLTTQPKKEIPTHVPVAVTGIPSTALCEQIHTVDCRRLGRFCGHCEEEEMKQIDAALLASLDLRKTGGGIFS